MKPTYMIIFDVIMHYINDVKTQKLPTSAHMHRA